MTEEHDFVAGICRTCGADESEFFCDLILSGKAGYYDNESQKGDVFISFGDHVTSIPALTRLMIVLAGSDRADHAAPESIVRKIDEQYAGDGKKVDDALAEIALNEAVTPYWRRYACRRIHDLKRRKETAESDDEDSTHYGRRGYARNVYMRRDGCPAGERGCF